jgi:hypothetical protein
MIFFITTILVIWFNTDAFVEYMQLLRINFFKIKQYIEAKQKDCTLTYHNYLLYKHNNFFTRLITCPICLTVWLCFLLYLFTDMELSDCPMIFICSLLLYYIFNKVSS